MSPQPASSSSRGSGTGSGLLAVPEALARVWPGKLLRRGVLLRAASVLLAIYGLGMAALFIFADADSRDSLRRWLAAQPKPRPVVFTAPGRVDTTPLVEALAAGTYEFAWADWLTAAALSGVPLGQPGAEGEPALDSEKYPHIAEALQNEETAAKGLVAAAAALWPLEKQSPQEEQALIGLLYCRERMPVPQRVAVLGDPADLVERTQPTPNYLVRTAGAPAHQQYAHEWNSQFPAFGPARVPTLNGTDYDSRLRVPIDHSMFVWPIKDILTLPAPADSRQQFEKTLLREALGGVRASGKYFHEVSLARDAAGLGMHYDGRFFRGVLAAQPHVTQIHYMMRAWSQFAENNGIAWWIAHGSGIGWYWNGMLLPWDSDNDVQMPVMELDRLANEFNGTLVVQRAEHGGHKYLIDVSPWYVQRVKGNGNNVIDARFIDVDTGVYIDLTGVAETRTKGVYNDKNNNNVSPDDLLPLRRVFYEGYAAYIPNRIENVLHTEYKNYEAPDFKTFHFNDKVRLWENDYQCADYRKEYSPGTIIVCTDKDLIDEAECDRDAFGTCDARILNLYEDTRQLTKIHSRERDLWDTVIFGGEENTRAELAELRELYRQYHAPTYRVAEFPLRDVVENATEGS